MSLVETQSPLAKELFNAAFLSCWNELYEQYQVRIQPFVCAAHVAWGALLTAREQYDVTNTEEWYERFGRWQEVLVVYDEEPEADPGGRRSSRSGLCAACMHWASRSSWHRRSTSGCRTRRGLDGQLYRDHALGLAHRFFYRVILSVHHNQFFKALTHILKAWELLHPELTAFGGAGYARSYNVLVRAQMLSELEKVVMYKQYADQPEKQQMMRNTWMKRLGSKGCQPNVEVWQRVLQVRTLIINPEDDPIPFIKFANLCRKSDHMALAEKTINLLLVPYRLQHLGEYNHMKASPNVVYAQLKYMWARGGSLAELRQFTISLAKDLHAESLDHAQRAGQRLNELSKLLAWCYFKQGEWQVAIDENCQIDTPAEGRSRDISGEQLAAHVVQSIEGFFRSISLRDEDALQETLRLLTLWFKYGAHDEISHIIASGFSMVKDRYMATRHPTTHVRRSSRNINNLFTEVGRSHLQVLIYPLTVGSKSLSESRKNAALAIMDRMREHSATIVEQDPQTVRETSFNQVFGTELRHAWEACRRYQLDNAWGISFAVFQKIEKQLPQLTALDLQCTYQSGREVIYIANFAPRLTVISAKRRMALKGSEGRDYQHLPKGHEDLQDERVMQLFSLVNTLLSVDTNSFKCQLDIQRYPIIPLAPNVGLIGIIQESDTLNELVREYRHSIKLLLNIEYRLMLQDLYKILWLKSTNSDHWLERRASYARSLAVNSMVGHILELAETGKVVHIDFGDCFQVAMHRDKFPAKVPFRLNN
ncbi:FAT domain-containing protein [Mycena epipterygia]|nr:FAT domain-containing protein [Mycena epipterygia]